MSREEFTVTLDQRESDFDLPPEVAAVIIEPVVQSELKAEIASAVDRLETPPIGHNAPPEPTPFERVAGPVMDLYNEAVHWLDGEPISNPEQAEAVTRLTGQLREATKAAEAQRKEAAKPFDEGKAAVQRQYNPVLERANLAIEACRKTLTPWVQKLEAEKRAVADKARAEAVAKAAAAAEAMRTASETDLAAREAAEALLKDAKKATVAANKAGRDRGSVAAEGVRRVVVVDKWVARLTDPPVALVHFWDKNRAECEAFLLDLAQASATRGARTIPGVEITNHPEAR